MNVETIARIAHETNRIYSIMVGDFTQQSWELAPDWLKQSIINGVEFLLKNRFSSSNSLHDSWLKEKLAAGWSYGKVKDIAKKEHPCCVPYDELSAEHKAKDALFLGVVRALSPLLDQKLE